MIKTYRLTSAARQRLIRQERIRASLFQFAEDFARNLHVRLATIVGVLASKYYPQVIDAFVHDTAPDFLFPTRWTFVLAAVIGVVVARHVDGKGDFEGQQKSWKRRWSLYFGSGFVWQTIIGGATAALGGNG
jgi:hypothetical protein